MALVVVVVAVVVVLVSIVVSIPACHAGDRGSIPRRGDTLSFLDSQTGGPGGAGPWPDSPTARGPACKSGARAAHCQACPPATGPSGPLPATWPSARTPRNAPSSRRSGGRGSRRRATRVAQALSALCHSGPGGGLPARGGTGCYPGPCGPRGVTRAVGGSGRQVAAVRRRERAPRPGRVRANGAGGTGGAPVGFGFGFGFDLGFDPGPGPGPGVGLGFGAEAVVERAQGVSW